MLHSNRGVVAVLGGGCALGLALALTYVFYLVPRQKAQAARDEIQEWSVHWQQARKCILGPQASYQDPATAIIVRHLVEANTKASIGRCRSSLKALRRSEGDFSENATIEDAWHKLKPAVTSVGQAHSWFSARTPSMTATASRRKLGDAIAKLVKM